MSHISLYRKYRPETWDQVLGQESIVATLKQSIEKKEISHAYIFSGSRGTGKTSVARIFAKALGTSPSDIYEIDAASHNGVDEIRELRDGVTTLPFDSKYKVYILDEAHMLSKAAFNALLKTLEEPPAHVIFILATTELHKVLDTIKSRCQIFEFKKPTLDTLKTMITTGADKEGYRIDDAAALMIAQLGDGAFRDTWGIVERVMRHSQDQTITSAEIVSAIGKPEQETILAFVEALAQKNLETSLQIVYNFTDQGHSLEFLLEGSLELLRKVLLCRFAPKLVETTFGEISPRVKEKVVAWSKEVNGISAATVSELLLVLDQVKKTSMPMIPVELALIRILGNNS